MGFKVAVRNIAVVNSTFRITVVEKRNIVVLNIAVGNKSCKNKMVIRNNAHGSYFIWIKNEGVGDMGVSMRGLLEFIVK